LTACNKRPLTPPVTIHTVSAIYIPDDQFECKGKVAKPVKQANNKYKESDVGKYINGLYLRGDDCETKLHSTRDIYKKQLEAQKNPSTGVDSKTQPN
jgi:hypothetical protein